MLDDCDDRRQAYQKMSANGRIYIRLSAIYLLNKRPNILLLIRATWFGRRLVNILVNRNGLRWRDAPSDYGPHKTRYNRW